MTAATREELKDLRESVRGFLEAGSDEAAVRRTMETDTGWDPALWTRMAEQLGLQSLALPERFGGDGFGFTELAVVLEEMGAALVCSPFLGTVVLAGGALVESGDDEACAAHLPGIAAGTTKAALAVAEQGSGSWDTDTIRASAVRSGGGWALTGEKLFVVDGSAADLLVVAARTDAGVSLFAVPADADGVRRVPMRTLDLTRRMARVSFEDTPAVLVGADGGAGAVLARVLDLATTALAAEQVGGARRCLETATRYAAERVQFGRPIGSFQAVKHKCADMLIRLTLAEAAAAEAADAASAAATWRNAPDGSIGSFQGSAADPETSAAFGVAAAVAHAVCSDAYMFIAAENIQVHGGIGFTWEHPAHLYFRRAKSAQLLFGGPAVYYERFLRRLGV